MQAVVLGAGVSGLTCALALQEAGHHVTVVARDEPPDTVSAAAGAMWYPIRGERGERTDDWLRASYERFTALARDPATGIVLRHGVELHRTPVDDARWRDILPGFRHETPPDGYADAWASGPVPVLDMAVYLRWLVRRIRVRGRLLVREVGSFDELRGDVVVNCAGLGARALSGDDSVRPIRGQVVRVEQVGIARFLLDEQHPDGVAYVIPRARDIVLGGVREEDDDDLRVRPAAARAILARCTALLPELRDARLVSHAVGLRPGRPSVRLEREGRVIHNYGHGGSGVGLSWGCAAEVVRLLSD